MATRVFHPIAQTTQVVFRYQHGSNRLENVFHYRWNNSTPPSVAELTNLCTEVGATICEKIRQFMTNGVQLIEVHARNMDVALGNQATAAFTPGTVGALIGQGDATGSTVLNLVTRTGLAGYGQHGAKRLGETSKLQHNGNTASGGWVTNCASVALSVVAARVGGRFLPSIPHINRLGTGTSSIITSCLLLDDDIDSQKTRLNNHGS
jgi:hypothetical protein